MKKAMILNTVQELEEVLVLQDIKAPGTYAVKGFDRPVNAMEVTPYGAAVLTNNTQTESCLKVPMAAVILLSRLADS
ncbi:Uncharacterised protein [uncultured Clostridium sp.]|nr:Uncharacterised protein [uncultured Clostridium sp.]